MLSFQPALRIVLSMSCMKSLTDPFTIFQPHKQSYCSSENIFPRVTITILEFIEAKGSHLQLFSVSDMKIPVMKGGVPGFSTSLTLLLRIYFSSPTGQVLFLTPPPPSCFLPHKPRIWCRRRRDQEKSGLPGCCRMLLSSKVGRPWTQSTHKWLLSLMSPLWALLLLSCWD